MPDSLRLAVLNETTASTSAEDDQLLLLDTNTIAMLKVIVFMSVIMFKSDRLIVESNDD